MELGRYGHDGRGMETRSSPHQTAATRGCPRSGAAGDGDGSVEVSGCGCELSGFDVLGFVCIEMDDTRDVFFASKVPFIRDRVFDVPVNRVCAKALGI